jgi:hypothetical protein
MNDTPQHIKELQLKIWLSKPPMERLRQMMEDNAALMQFWAEARKVSGGGIEQNPNLPTAH